MSKIDKLVAEFAEQKAQFQAKVKEEFNLLFAEFFEQNPEVNYIGWRQYTPYFNDGSPCTFSCYAYIAFATNAKEYGVIQYGQYTGDDEENVWVDDPDYGGHNHELVPESVTENMENLRHQLSQIPDDFFLEVFGDHVVVYATRDGFEVEEFEHD
jgi:hypothetical protein